MPGWLSAAASRASWSSHRVESAFEPALIDHFDGHGPLEPAIVGAIHEAHAAGTDQGLDPIRSNVLANADEQVILCGHGDNRKTDPPDPFPPRENRCCGPSLLVEGRQLMTHRFPFLTSFCIVARPRRGCGVGPCPGHRPTRTTYLTFSTPVALPGVTLAAGTYAVRARRSDRRQHRGGGPEQGADRAVLHGHDPARRPAWRGDAGRRGVVWRRRRVVRPGRLSRGTRPTRRAA